MEKMEALLIGTPEHRNKIITEIILSADTNKIPEYIHLIKYGKPMRTLGSWVGNNIIIEDKWKKIMEIQKKVIDVWTASHPTLRGKELILKALIMSISWFLAAVNGMPDQIENEMTKIMNYLGWKQKRTNEAALYN